MSLITSLAQVFTVRSLISYSGSSLKILQEYMSAAATADSQFQVVVHFY